MRRIASYLALIWVVFLVSCEKETLEPRTNPRFSVTFIQEISSSGVQFGADIYDFGDEEILEYGFVYTQSTGAPNLNQDDYISLQGRPEGHFELVANHSMTLGKKYYVSAFLKTPTSLVFSKSMEFVSQGSEGFIINSIEWPDVIYRDQKLVVKGQRFSKQRANYKVQLGQFIVYPDLVDSNTFTINLPADLLTQTTGQDIETELRIEINEKSYIQKRVLKFQEPIFETQPVQKIKLGDEVIIKGDYFDLGPIDLKIGNQTINGLIAQKSELKFFLIRDSELKPTISEPEVTFIVRGISYELGKLFQLNGPKITEEKIILNKDTQLIPINNYAFENLYANQFYEEGGTKIEFQLLEGKSNGIVVGVGRTVFPSRNFKMQVSSLGVLSNLVEVEVVNPVVLINVSGRKYSYSEQDVAINSGDKTFVLTNQGIISETIRQNFLQEKIAELPVNVNSRIIIGVKQAVKDGFVFGAGFSGSEFFHDLYFFSLEQLQWEKLPDLPNDLNGFGQVTSKDGFLIFEKARKEFQDQVGEKWLLNLQMKVWQKIPNPSERFLYSQTFYDNGETYLHGNESPLEFAIYRMRADFSWEKFMETPNLNQPSIFATPLVIDRKYYVFSNLNYHINEIDLNSKTIKKYPYPYYYNGRVPVPSSDGIYILPSEGIMEDIRLNLF